MKLKILFTTVVMVLLSMTFKASAQGVIMAYESNKTDEVIRLYMTGYGIGIEKDGRLVPMMPTGVTAYGMAYAAGSDGAILSTDCQTLFVSIGGRGGYYTFKEVVDTSGYSGSYGSYGGNYGGSSSGGSSVVKQQCSLCHGKGWIAGTSTPTYGSSSSYYCSECGRQVPGSHSHDRCPSCSGTGYITTIR